MEPQALDAQETGSFAPDDAGAPARTVDQTCESAGSPSGAQWTLDRTINPVDAASLLATILLAAAAVWYFEPRHSRRTAAFELFSDTLATAIDGISGIEAWILRDAPATRNECESLLVQFRSLANALWLLARFARQRKCRRDVTDLLENMAKQRQLLYDHLTSTGFPADQWQIDEARRLRATSMVALFRKDASQLRAELIREL